MRLGPRLSPWQQAGTCRPPWPQRTRQARRLLPSTRSGSGRGRSRGSARAQAPEQCKSPGPTGVPVPAPTLQRGAVPRPRGSRKDTVFIPFPVAGRPWHVQQDQLGVLGLFHDHFVELHSCVHPPHVGLVPGETAHVGTGPGMAATCRAPGGPGQAGGAGPGCGTSCGHSKPCLARPLVVPSPHWWLRAAGLRSVCLARAHGAALVHRAHEQLPVPPP